MFPTKYFTNYVARLSTKSGLTQNDLKKKKTPVIWKDLYDTICMTLIQF